MKTIIFFVLGACMTTLLCQFSVKAFTPAPSPTPLAKPVAKTPPSGMSGAQKKSAPAAEKSTGRTTPRPDHTNDILLSGFPDLVVKQIKLIPASDAYHKKGIKVLIQNTGDTDAVSSFYVKVRLDRESYFYEAWVLTSGLVKGAARWVEFTSDSAGPLTGYLNDGQDFSARATVDAYKVTMVYSGTVNWSDLKNGEGTATEKIEGPFVKELRENNNELYIKKGLLIVP